MFTAFATKSQESVKSHTKPAETNMFAWKQVMDNTVIIAKNDARTLYTRSRAKWPSYPNHETREVVWSLQTELRYQETIWPDRYELTYTLSLERVPAGLEPLEEVFTASKVLVVPKEPLERRINWGN